MSTIEMLEIGSFSPDLQEVPTCPASPRLTVTTSTRTSAQVSRSRTFYNIRQFGSRILSYQLDVVGKKDYFVLLYLIVLGLLWTGTFWSLALINKRRAVPSKELVSYDLSDWAYIIRLRKNFCSSNATWSFQSAVLKLNTWNNGVTLNESAQLCDKNNNFTYEEIATCLGCNSWNVFTEVVYNIFFISRLTIPLTILVYATSELDKLNAKSLIKKLVIIWLVAVFLLGPTERLWHLYQDTATIFFVYLSAFLIAVVLILKYWSIKPQVNPRMVPLWIVVIIGTLDMGLSPNWGFMYMQQLQAYLPIILTFLDTLACKVTVLSFKDYRGNHLGQAHFIGIYTWYMEAMRFDCFMALYLGWKSNFLELQDVLLNILFSILGEIWTHTGIREALEDSLEQKVNFIQLKSSFPEIRTIFSSIRHILEWLLPAITLGMLFFMEQYRDYIPVTDDNLRSQLRFSTGVRLHEHMFEIAIVYYSVEVISLMLCGLISYLMDYKEISLVGSLSKSQIFLWSVFLVLQTDLGFTGYMWSAAVGGAIQDFRQ